MNQKGISVIICCYNSAQRIRTTLEHLIQQQFSYGFSWEIIVVNNASTDNTEEVAQSTLTSSRIPFQIVFEKQPGQSFARRTGFKSARYDLILCCDDDNWLAPTYVQRAHDLMREQPSIGILGGWGSAKFEAEEPFWFSKFQQNFAVGPQSDEEDVLTKVDLVYGAGCTIRHDILREIYAPEITLLLSGRTGNKLMSGDDNEWCYLVRFMGYEIAFSRELRFDHYMPSSRMNWEYLKKLHVGFGRTYVYTGIYAQLMNNDPIPGNGLRLPFWIDHLIHRLKELYTFYPEVKGKFRKEGHPTVLRWFDLRGELMELWSIKKQIMMVYHTVSKNKTHLRSRAAISFESIPKED